MNECNLLAIRSAIPVQLKIQHFVDESRLLSQIRKISLPKTIFVSSISQLANFFLEIKYNFFAEQKSSQPSRVIFY